MDGDCTRGGCVYPVQETVYRLEQNLRHCALDAMPFMYALERRRCFPNPNKHYRKLSRRCGCWFNRVAPEYFPEHMPF